MRKATIIVALALAAGLAGTAAALADPLPGLDGLGIDISPTDDELDVGEEMCALPG
ncbi:MAG: hypothetical protein ACE5H8_03575 [Alphaproteobacteria bacterium]